MLTTRLDVAQSRRAHKCHPARAVHVRLGTSTIARPVRRPAFPYSGERSVNALTASTVTTINRDREGQIDATAVRDRFCQRR